MKRLLFALTACISFVFIGCNKQPTIDTHSTFEACYASEDTIPAFLEKYDSITNANLDAFINDWYVYSRAIVKDYVPVDTINEICVTEFKEAHLHASKDYRFIVLPLRVEVYYIDKTIDMFDFVSGPYLWRRCKYLYWQCFKSKNKDVVFYNFYNFLVWNEEYQKRYITPILSGQDSILYLTDGIYDKLASYLGGLRIGEINEDLFAPINQQHVEVLNERKYFEIQYGHWGGYWHLETMPITEYISLFRNGAIVSTRKSFWITDEYWYELNNSGYERHSEPVGGWIE